MITINNLTDQEQHDEYQNFGLTLLPDMLNEIIDLNTRNSLVATDCISADDVFYSQYLITPVGGIVNTNYVLTATQIKYWMNLIDTAVTSRYNDFDYEVFDRKMSDMATNGTLRDGTRVCDNRHFSGALNGLASVSSRIHKAEHTN